MVIYIKLIHHNRNQLILPFFFFNLRSPGARVTEIKIEDNREGIPMRMKGIRREVSTTPLSSGSASRLRGNNLLGLSREAGACRLSLGDAGHYIHCHFALAVMQPLCPPSRRAGRQGVEPSIP